MANKQCCTGAAFDSTGRVVGRCFVYSVIDTYKCDVVQGYFVLLRVTKNMYKGFVAGVSSCFFFLCLVFFFFVCVFRLVSWFPAGKSCGL